MEKTERCSTCAEYRELMLETEATKTGLSLAELDRELPMAWCVKHTIPHVTIEQMRQITPHPNAHSLDVAMVGQHRVVTGRHYNEGQYGYYIPEGAVVPDVLAEEMELLGLLDGPDHNVVKSRKMRGILSEGLFYGFGLNGGHDPDDSWEEGQDVTVALGVTFVAI